MGVDLGDLVQKETISVDSFSGKTLALDSYNILYQFLSSIRQEDGTPLKDSKGNVTAHLSGLFYRTSKFLEAGIRPIFVFDGKANPLKHKVQQERIEAKETAIAKWKAALEVGNADEARKYAQATGKLTREMVAESIELLSALGVPSIQAVSDGEAQAAMMVQKGLAYATASQDYDALLFGSPLLIRNLSISGRRKVPRQDRYVLVEPEQLSLKDSLSFMGIDRLQLILLGTLLGTDFNEGVPRVGPKTALKIVKENKTPDQLISYVKTKYEYEFEVDLNEVIQIFLNPPYTDVADIKWNSPDLERISKILVDKHDFSIERVEKTINDLKKTLTEKGAQSRLEQWF
ncbi:MAG: flap endonuclease-1 [Candidatus Bilamarchaeum sp.]